MSFRCVIHDGTRFREIRAGETMADGDWVPIIDVTDPLKQWHDPQKRPRDVDGQP